MALSDYYKGFNHEMIDVGNDIKINTYWGGSGEEAVILLHGHPESYLTWHNVAPKLAEKYTVVVTDMRGYGDSSKPFGEPDHSTYSKREMAKDQVAVMDKLGIKKFHVAGHDRGARVCHRLIIDHADRVKSCTFLDIIPTYDVYATTNKDVAYKQWHWFFYTQPYDFAETILSATPEYFIRSNIQKKTIPGTLGAEAFPEDVIREYIRCYSNPATVHAIAEDYRAGMSIDLVQDEPDRERMIETPILCVWGSDGMICKTWDVLETWKKRASNVRGYEIKGCGHFLPQEKPEEIAREIAKHIEENK